MPVSALAAVVGLSILGLSPVASADGYDVAEADVYSPFEPQQDPARYVLDMEVIVNDRTGAYIQEQPEQPDLSALGTVDQFIEPPADLEAPSELPEEFIQIGEVVQYKAVALGFKDVTRPSSAYEDLPGNEYPRKHTIFLNFNGGIMKNGSDNSAINKSSLARHNEMYPIYGGSEQSALAKIQAVTEDMAPLGIRVKYADRPHNRVPYTMCMIGGHWSDTTIGDPAGGVAPGTDCEGRNQRHVVYAFGDAASSTVSQELAHAWGLDHLYGFDMIMSYQGSGNKDFATTCRDLCEEGCQGPGSIGCRLTHEIYCGEGSEQQYDYEELAYIFGSNEPDTEPPSMEITNPADGQEFPVGASTTLTLKVSDNYGGYGWSIKIEQNGEVVYDDVDWDQFAARELSNLPEGVYTVTATVEDHADHVTTDQVTFFVGDATTEPNETTGAGTTGASGTGDPSGDPTDPSSTSAGPTGETIGDPTAGGDTDTDSGIDGDEGCGCTSQGASRRGAPATFALFAGLLWARRRRGSR